MTTTQDFDAEKEYGTEPDLYLSDCCEAGVYSEPVTDGEDDYTMSEPVCSKCKEECNAERI